MNAGPLVVQSDRSLLLEVDHPDAPACRIAIAPFAELERAPEHVHTYRITPLGLWNACAAGHDAEEVVDALLSWSRYPVPSSLLLDITETIGRYGRLRIEKHPVHGLVLVSTDKAVLTEVLRTSAVKGLVRKRCCGSSVMRAQVSGCRELISPPCIQASSFQFHWNQKCTYLSLMGQSMGQ